MHGDVDDFHGRSVGEDSVGDELGKPLDEIHMFALDDRDDVLGHAPVIDGVFEIVRLAGLS